MKLIDASTPKYPNTFAMVDDTDFEYLNQWKWRRGSAKNTTYLRRKKVINGSRTSTFMHREILSPPKGATIDHIDGNGLNNQRSNLRLATHAENSRNKGIVKTNTSGYIGVCWHKRDRMWRATIEVNRKAHHIMYSHDIIEAARARDAAALKYHGEFARLNFPNTQERKAHG